MLDPRNVTRATALRWANISTLSMKLLEKLNRNPFLKNPKAAWNRRFGESERVMLIT
jgi:hypothetical protein